MSFEQGYTAPFRPGLVGDGRPEEREAQLAAIAQVEEAIAARAAARKAATHAGKAATQGISTKAYEMRERRKNPEIKKKGNDAAKAHHAALAALGRNHPEELLALEQIERKKVGMAVLVPRARRQNAATKTTRRTSKADTAKVSEVRAAATELLPEDRLIQPPKLGQQPTMQPPKPKKGAPPQAVLTPPPQSVQDKCRHNMGLTKLSYGTFCVECGHKVR